MEHRPLGKSGLLVSVLCLGTMVFGEENPRGTDQTSATHIIQKFLDAGGNHIDTANVYAGGRSEEIVGAAIKDRRDRVILATKVRNATGQGLNDQGLSRCHMIRRGYSSRFGPVRVDYRTQRRLPKQSAHWHREVIEQNAIST